LTDSLISPIRKGDLIPQIYLLSGRFANKPASWSNSSFNNGNNHSLVIKVIFGKASFLFTGDLETEGIAELMKAYANCNALDVDILRVGHHGAGNATTAAFLQAVSPVCAVISCGHWDYEEGPPPKSFTTFSYGHPSKATLDALEAVIPANRAVAIPVKAGLGGKSFTGYKISKNIYATPWDHHILMEATADAKYTVFK